MLIELLWLEAGFCVGCVGCLLAAFMAGKFVVCLIMLFIDCGLGIWMLILHWFGWVGFGCGIVWVWFEFGCVYFCLPLAIGGVSFVV